MSIDEAKPRHTLVPDDPFRLPAVEPSVEERKRFEGVAEEATLRALAEREWEKFEASPPAPGSGSLSPTASLSPRALRGDAAKSSGASGRHARWLGVREREEEAVHYARRALRMGSDAVLRGEMVTWLVKLGRLDEAATELAPLARVASPRDKAEIAQRRAIYLAKSGDAASAYARLEEALSALPGDPLSLELSAALSRYVPERVGTAAPRYVAAAHVRRAHGDTDIATFDLCRAIACGSDTMEAARTLAGWASADGRHERAQEILRAATRRLRDDATATDATREAASELAKERRTIALAAGEPLLALLACLDMGEDRRFAGDDHVISSLLLEAGLLEWLAGRTLVAASIARDPAERALRFDALVKLFQGPLASQSSAEGAGRLALRTSGVNALIARIDDGLGQGDDARDALVAMCRSSDASARRAAAWELLSRMTASHPGYLFLAERVLAAFGVKTNQSALSSALIDAEQIEAELMRLRQHAAGSPEDFEQALPFLERAIEWPSVDSELIESFVLLFAAFAGRGYVPLSFWRVGDRLATRMRNGRERLQLWKRLLTFDGESRRGPRLNAISSSIGGAVRAELVKRVVETALECGDTSYCMGVLRDELPRADEFGVAVTLALARTLGKDEIAARALSRVAAPSSASAAALGAVAAEWLMPYDMPVARATAERACHADPQSVRAVVALADTTTNEEPLVRAAALERVSTLLMPSAAACAECASLLRTAGKPALALAWLRQWSSLEPGSVDAVRAALDASVDTKDSALVAETIEWALGQMLTRAELAEVIDRAFAWLESEDTARAVAVARRILRSVGVPAYVSGGSKDWGARLRMLARKSGEGRLALSLAALESGVSTSDALLDLAALARESADIDSEVRYLVAALRVGSRDLDAISRVRILAKTANELSGDANLGIAEALTYLAADDAVGERAAALREYGFALWELAGDDSAAIGAWFAAAALLPGRGFKIMRGDLVRAFGARGAFDVLADHARRAQDTRTAAALSREAAFAALENGAYEEAFSLAVRALDLDPERADALEVAERAAIECNGLDRLATQYDRVAARARGRYGRRAAHFRAARFFLGSEQHGLAFQQAASAFMAVPTEGSSLRLLCEAAERGHNRVGVARALEEVANRERSPHDRATWLLRAADYAGEGDAGAARHADLVLAALAAAPTPGIALRMRDAVLESRGRAPQSVDVLRGRVQGAWEGVKKRLEGPDGARVALVFSRVAAEALGDAMLAWETLLGALERDGDVDDYANLGRHVAPLVAHPEALVRAMETTARPYANVGIAALELLHRIASEARHTDFAWQTAALAANKERSDRTIERALSLTPGRDAAGEHLVASLGKKAILDAAERASMRANAAGKPRWAERMAAGVTKLFDVAAADELAARIAQGGTAPALLLESAPDAISGVGSERTPPHSTEIVDLGDAVRDAIADPASVMRSDFPARPSLRGLALAPSITPKRSGAPGASSGAEVSRNVGGIEDALRESGDYSGLVAYLGRRVDALERTQGNDDLVRALRLRRAVVLEQHLDRAVEARAELEKTLAGSVIHEGTRRYALDLAERAQDWDYLEARLTEWLAASSSDAPARSEWSERLGRLLVARGAFDRAEALLTSVNIDHATSGELCLIVRVARANQDRERFERALSMLEARADGGDSSERAAVFLEAAQDALARGDTSAAMRWANAGERAERPKGSVSLFAMALGYKLTRWSASDARHAEGVLESVNLAQLGVDDIALRALLLAEARAESRAARTGDDGLRVLREAESRVGAHPLIAVGIAERLARLGACAEALPYFDAALSGNLFGLRRAGGVALAAADAARGLGQDELACTYLERAAEDPQLLVRARRRLADVLLVVGRVDEARQVLRELAPRAAGDERSHALRDLALTYAASDPQQERERRRLLAEARDVAASEGVRSDIDRELARHRESMLPPMPFAEAEPPSVVKGARTVAARASARIRLARDLLATDSVSSETLLRRAVDEGSIDACDELAILLERRRAPWSDVVAFRRLAAERSPGNLARLEALTRAAREDKNVRYGAALDHLLSCFGPRHLVRLPPPLLLQSKITATSRLLMEPSAQGGGEVFAALWQDARDLWTRRYSRPPTGRNNSLAARFLETVEASMSLLDSGRVNVEVVRGAQAYGYDLRLSGPTVEIRGDVGQDSPELRYLLGRALCAAHPMHLLPMGMPFEAFARVWKSVEIAFGERRADDDGEARQLIAGLWEMVGAPNQRRIRAWLVAHRAATATSLAEEARQSGRRTGLFLAGDFGVTARLVAREFEIPESEATTGYGLEGLCRDVPALTDLYRLALSPEYAEARWSAWNQGASS